MSRIVTGISIYYRHKPIDLIYIDDYSSYDRFLYSAYGI
jgi:hypothetical protein